MSAAALTVPASSTEILSLDWNKYRPFVLASSGVDKMVKVWDCRMVKLGGQPGEPGVGGVCETQLIGHEYAVRKVQWSPHRPDVLASASYDMTCRMYVSFHLHTDHGLTALPDGQLYQLPAEGICFTFMTPIPNLLWDVDGHYTTMA